MKIAFSQICRDYLALRGESPDLLPLLEEGEDSAVLTLTDELRVRLLTKATEATLALPRMQIDEIRSASPEPDFDNNATMRLRMPEDYLKLYSLQMPDWREPVIEPEPEGSLRFRLGAHAPAWMVCSHRPMVRERRDSEGVFLEVFGTESRTRAAELLYVPRPHFDGEYLTISAAALKKILL